MNDYTYFLWLSLSSLFFLVINVMIAIRNNLECTILGAIPYDFLSRISSFFSCVVKIDIILSILYLSPVNLLRSLSTLDISAVRFYI